MERILQGKGLFYFLYFWQHFNFPPFFNRYHQLSKTFLETSRVTHPANFHLRKHPPNPNLNTSKRKIKSTNERKAERPESSCHPRPTLHFLYFSKTTFDTGTEYSYEEYKNAGLSTPKVEKSSSFKRKNKPAHLENMMAREMTDPIKNPAVRSDSRNNGRKEQEYNIVLLGDFGVGKTGKYNWEIR